jgi:hypothetical protein
MSISVNHFQKTFYAISYNQWIGLLLSLIASTLTWLKLVFIVNGSKKNSPKFGKYQIYALLIGWVITFILWGRLLAVIDPLKNNQNDNCNCKCN